MKKARPNTYCFMCGNALDPKIHVDLGKTSKKVAEFQETVLKGLLKELYYTVVTLTTEQSKHFKSITKELEAIQNQHLDNLTKVITDGQT